MKSGTDQPGTGDSPEQKEFGRSVRRFLATNAKPKQESRPWAVNFHVDPEKARREFEEGRAWQMTRYKAGMAGFTYPKEYGGQGGAAWQEQIYQEEAANYGSSSGFVAATIAMLGPTLMAFGSEDQKRTLIPRLLSGEDAWCQLFSEPGSGSDLASLGCRAVRDGDEFIVTGQKVWNSAAQWCDHGFLLARTNPDVPKHRGITMLLIDMGAPGVEVRPLVQATGAAHFNEVFLSEVRVPVSNVLGDIDGGWAAARTVLSNEAAMIGGGGARNYDSLIRLAELYSRRSRPRRPTGAGRYLRSRTDPGSDESAHNDGRTPARKAADGPLAAQAVFHGQAGPLRQPVSIHSRNGSHADRRRADPLGGGRGRGPLQRVNRRGHHRGAEEQPRRASSGPAQGAGPGP